MKRRALIGSFGAAAITSIAASAATPPAGPDYFDRYLDVIRVWKKHDIEAVLAHMSDDIVWYVYVSQQPVRGKADVRALLGKLAPTRHAENWRVFHHAVNGARLFVEGVDDFTDATAHRIAVPYMGVVEFQDGLISGWRDYFDGGVVTGMKNGGPVPDAIEPLVSRKGVP